MENVKGDNTIEDFVRWANHCGHYHVRMAQLHYQKYCEYLLDSKVRAAVKNADVQDEE